MGFEVSPNLGIWIKAAAVVVAVLVAYSAKGDTFRRVITKLMPKKSQSRMQQENMDGAWRELMDDSITRNCQKSVALLNDWMDCRTTSRLGEQSEKSDI